VVLRYAQNTRELLSWEVALLRYVFLACAALAVTGPAEAADVAAGKKFFEAQCSLCHSAAPNDGGGGQGPDLHRLLGKSAATADATFPYTQALKDSKLVWDAPKLETFLADPGKMVPGTAMPLTVPGKADRDNLVAFFQSLK